MLWRLSSLVRTQSWPSNHDIHLYYPSTEFRGGLETQAQWRCGRDFCVCWGCRLLLLKDYGTLIIIFDARMGNQLLSCVKSTSSSWILWCAFKTVWIHVKPEGLCPLRLCVHWVPGVNVPWNWHHTVDMRNMQKTQQIKSQTVKPASYVCHLTSVFPIDGLTVLS